MGKSLNCKVFGEKFKDFADFILSLNLVDYSLSFQGLFHETQ